MSSNDYANAMEALARAARAFVVDELNRNKDVYARETALAEAAHAFNRDSGQGYGKMFVEVCCALGIAMGTTQRTHDRVLKKICTLQIERDEAVRKHALAESELTVALGNPVGFPYPLTWDDLLLKVHKLRSAEDERREAVRKLEVIQADANVALEQRREADREAAKARDDVKAHEAALELACNRANEYKLALETSAKTSIEMIDKIQKLQAQVDECFEQVARANARAKENESERVRQLEAENARLKQRIDSAEINLGYAREALSSVENELGYVSGKLRGNHDR